MLMKIRMPQLMLWLTTVLTSSRGLPSMWITASLNALVLAEEITDLRVVTQAQRTDEHRHRDLAVLIDAHIKNVVGIRFVFQPRAAVGVQRGGEQFLARLCRLWNLVRNIAPQRSTEDGWPTPV